MHLTTKNFVVASLVTLAALTAPTFAQGSNSSTAPSSTKAQGECPDFVRGSRLTVNDIDGGVQFKITTNQPSNVSSLRGMVHDAATFVEQNERTGSNAQAQQGSQQPQFPPLDISVQNIDGGAQVSVKAENTTDVTQVRGQAKSLEKLWKSSSCINGQAKAG